MEKLRLFLLSSFCLVLLFSTAAAQDVSSWYWKERFYAADANENAMLDKAELSQFPSEFMYFLESNYYTLSDENKDGFLSFNEIVNRRKAEAAYRTAMEKRQLAQLEANYSELKKATSAFLLSNPSLTKTLFTNATWAMQNPVLIREICNNTTWMNSHPDVAHALSHNLLWMTSCPKQAKTLYGSRNFMANQPELLGWRSNHIKFMRQHPVLEDLCTIEGYTGMIVLGKK